MKPFQRKTACTLVLAIFAAFCTEAATTTVTEQEEKNPFQKEIAAVRRLEKKMEKTKPGSPARKRMEENLKKEKQILADAVKAKTAPYEKELQSVENTLKRKKDKSKDTSALENRQKELKVRIDSLKAFGKLDDGKAKKPAKEAVEEDADGSEEKNSGGKDSKKPKKDSKNKKDKSKSKSK